MFEYEDKKLANNKKLLKSQYQALYAYHLAFCIAKTFKKLGLLHNLLALQNCDALLSIIQIRKVQGITPCVLSSCCDWYCPALSR